MPDRDLVTVIIEPLRIFIHREQADTVRLRIARKRQTAEQPLAVVDVPVDTGGIGVVLEGHRRVEAEEPRVYAVAAAEIVRQRVSLVDIREQSGVEADAARVKRLQPCLVYEPDAVRPRVEAGIGRASRTVRRRRSTYVRHLPLTEVLEWDGS